MRPRPVLILAALMAGLSALAGAGHLLDFLPDSVVSTILLVDVVVAAVGGVLVQGAVTPLSAPQNADGVPLVTASALAPMVTQAAREGALQARRDGGTLRS